MAKDQDILDQVNQLVADELGPRPKGRGRLRAFEAQLDQRWDLLPQRRALRETSGDPREASVRPPDEVEGCLN